MSWQLLYVVIVEVLSDVATVVDVVTGTGNSSQVVAVTFVVLDVGDVVDNGSRSADVGSRARCSTVRRCSRLHVAA